VNETIEYLAMFAQFPFALRRFLRHKLTLDEAKAIVRERMEHRNDNFMRVAERSIYGYPRSPYLPLLKMAGCELGDLRGLVKEKGLEGALHELRKAGVYVTYEEFKGRKPIVRNGTTIPVRARAFDNPFARHNFTLRTGGSTGLSTHVAQDLDYIAAGTPHRILALAAHGVLDVPQAAWGQILPGRTLITMLQMAYYGHMPERFFSSIGWHESRYWLKYDLATYYIIFWMRLCGVRLPLPEFVRTDQALLVARWVNKTLQIHHRCLLFANPSHALRVCVAAQEAGLDLTGAVMRGGGEPVTPAKIEAMRRAGVRYIPGYGMTEAGSMSVGCTQPSDVSDVHLFKDAFALIPFPYVVERIGETVPAFNLTALLDSAPLVMLNVQLDDYGVVEERPCGCELEELGYTTHLRDIYSYSKLVGEGVTLIGNEMLHILEDVLPARFGGTPLDYQLREQEDGEGLTRLYLVISPRVQITDEQAVVQVVLQSLGKSSPMADAARTVWQQARTIYIKREEPVLSPRGKQLPLYLQRGARNP
jgi:hypothetical protein